MTALRITVAALVAAAGLLVAPAPADAGHACNVASADRWSSWGCGIARTSGQFYQVLIGDSHTDGYCVTAYVKVDYSAGWFGPVATECTTGGTEWAYNRINGYGDVWLVRLFRGSSPYNNAGYMTLCSDSPIGGVPSCS